MKTPRRVRFVLLAGALVLCPCIAAAQPAWKPEKPVELIAPSAPGGGTDKTARLMQKLWQDKRALDVPVTVVNKSGGQGAVALTYLKSHAADAHYLEIVSAVLLTSHISGASSYSYTDFSPIALLNSEYVVFAVKADSPLGNLNDLRVRLRKDPASASIAVGTSLGGANHIAAAFVARAAGADTKKLKTIVFRSSAESAVAGLGGHVDVVISSASILLPHLNSGAMRFLAVSAPQRSAGALAAVPTLREQGVDAVVDNFRLVLAAPGLAPAQAAYWEQVLMRLSATEEWKSDLERNVWENAYRGSRDTRRYLDAQYAELKSVLTDMGFAK
ncbi:MAG TPA: tripartite tricarboxylate transporter substrate binding protein [Burkholderiales bacterium]|nr:tripartite tricarboxylate transporter substrate binding protein [Burkholderiales bacterium]